MLEFFYDTQLSEEDAERIQNLKEEIITPAEMSKVMFENFSDIQASIIHMENLYTGNQGFPQSTFGAQGGGPLGLRPVRPLLSGEQLEITGSEEVEEDDNQTLPVEGLSGPLTRIPKDGIAVQGGDPERGLRPKGNSSTDELQTSPDQSSIEEKGEKVTPSSNSSGSEATEGVRLGPDVKTNEEIIERIHHDTIYVFMKYKLPYYASSNNIKKLTIYDCKKLLVKHIFCNHDYQNLIHKLKTKFYNVVISPIELDNMQINNIGVNYTIYSRELSEFFDSSVMKKSGLRQALVDKKIIDNEYETINTRGFTAAPTVLNSSSYSAF
jgi:hypothetical protein